MAEAVYILSAVTSVACAWLLLRAYARTRTRLLLWSGLCFVGFGLNNIALVVDRLVVPDTDLATWRLVPAAAGILLLVYGLVWDAE